MNRTTYWIFYTEIYWELILFCHTLFFIYFFMLQTVTKFDTQISVSLMLGFVFLLAGLYWTSNDNVSSNKYQRWDYGGLLFFYTPMLLLFFLSKAGYFE